MLQGLWRTSRSVWLQGCFFAALGCLAAVVPEAAAGKLRSSLIDASNNLRAVGKQVGEVSDDFGKISSNSWQLMQMTAGGIDETYLYINQKLKAKGEKYKDHLKKPISEFADKNVKAFVKGIADGTQQAIKFSKQWSDVGDRLKGSLEKLDGSLGRHRRADRQEKAEVVQVEEIQGEAENL